MKFWLGVLFSSLVMSPIVQTVTEYETFVRVEAVDQSYDSTPTPVIDSLIDWEEQDRQNNCLWFYLEKLGWELTLESVMLAGSWADANGGACLLIGEDDE
jgi:hypothetical protein